MIRKLALTGAVLALAGASTLAAQAATQAPAKPAAQPTAQAPAKTAPDTQHHVTAHTGTEKGFVATRSRIEHAQRILARHGLYKGKATGQVNDDFTAALRQYQENEKLTATGQLDSATWESLMKAEKAARTEKTAKSHSR
ncbi:MAG TPA: peptidoglycan-binding domain-containing protein [Gemmatimonadales bacterium]|jgi:peptidoglycan hydrolase-like protein with peptidoglycan-binding domain|nr:peptidoglycan-binding domain-containing protein [Gemmatimonadales bacterium]